MEHPKDVGDRTTLAVMLALQGLGYSVAVPFGENTRYDLIVDDGIRLQRVQCKTGRLRDGVVVFRTASSYAHHPNPKPRQLHYGGQVDAFAVYCPENACVYVIPIDGLPRRAAALRVNPTKNGQRKLIRTASSYEVATVAVTCRKRARASHN
jgi:hypothetical protein